MSNPFQRPPWLRAAIAAGGEFHAMKKEPRLHNLKNLGASLGLVLAFAGVVGLGVLVPAWAYILPAAILFGCIYFAVNILVVHECSHNMFLLSRDRERQRRLNRSFGVLAAIPFFTDYIRHWEQGHTTHHLRPCEPDDPQDRDPLTGRAYFRVLLLAMLVPFSFVAFNPSKQYPGQLKRAALGLMTWVPLVLLTGTLISWAVPVALVLALHVTMVLNLTKKAQEHGAGLANEPDYALRSRTYLYPLAPLTSPFHINYHFEHHANFNVPWYDLPRYHQRLRAIVPVELQPYYFHHDFLDQIRGIKPLPPRELLFTEKVA